MSTLTRITPIVNPASAVNPRDSWPDWTVEDRWATGPDDSPEFIPSAKDLADASALLNADATDYWTDSSDSVVTFPACVMDYYPRPSTGKGGAL